MQALPETTMENEDLMKRELAAMAEIGSRRLRARTIIFAISAVTISAIGIAGGFGILLSVFVSAPLAALLAFAVAKGLNDKFITETAAKYSLPPESLSADKYLID